MDNFIIEPGEKILVTGANGFIGQKVIRALLTYGYTDIRCMTRKKESKNLEALASESGASIQIFHGNLLSKDDCTKAAEGVSVIYHLAAGVGKSYAGCYLDSVLTTKNLLDAVFKAGTLKRFVNISTIAVYSNENIKKGGLFDESCPVDDRLLERHEAYTYAKFKQDELVLEYADKFDIPYVIVRPSVVFGPGKAKISARIASDSLGIYLHLGLNNRIPLSYVDNCAEAIVLAGLKKGIEGQVFNICDDDLPRSRDFLKLYKQKVNRFFTLSVPHWMWFSFCSMWEKYSKWSEGQLPPVFNRRACSFYWKDHEYSNRKAKEMLGWQPAVPMPEALDRFFKYMKQNEETR